MNIENTISDLNKIGEKEEIATRSRLATVPNDVYAHDVINRVQYDRYRRIHSRLEQIHRTNPSLLQFLDFKRFKMYLDSEDRGSLYTLATHTAGSLEPFELSVFCEMVRRNPGSLFIDLGANYGLYTLHACDLGRDNYVAKVVAVEPDQRVFKKLSKSVKENGFEKTAILLNKAISDQDDEQITLFVNKGGSPDNRTFVDGGINFSSQYLVNTISVDTIVSEVGMTGLEHNGIIIKMDIQGNEPRAFKGMKKTLSQYPSVALLFEFDPALMKQEGFDPFEFAHEVFGAGFSDIIHVDETAQLLQPLTSVDELIRDIRHYCGPHRPKGTKRYLNLLCYRNMKGPCSVNENITPMRVKSEAGLTEIQTDFPECMVRGEFLPPMLTFDVINKEFGSAKISPASAVVNTFESADASGEPSNVNRSREVPQVNFSRARNIASYCPETCLIFVSYGRAEVAARSYESLSLALAPYRDRVRIVISDATDDEQKMMWARNTDADDVILTPRFTAAATSRNIATTLVLDKYSPRYLCMVEDDFEYSTEWYPSIVDATNRLYGVMSPMNLAYGIFSACDHHVPAERCAVDEQNGVTAYIFGAVAYQRFMPTSHYLSVMRYWDSDLLGISWAQTGGQTFRNVMRGFCGAILNGRLSRPLDIDKSHSTWVNKRPVGPNAHSFNLDDYDVIRQAAQQAGVYLRSEK